ncbi:MAG: GNAT family protein [Pseudomonadota bacterium]
MTQPTAIGPQVPRLVGERVLLRAPHPGDAEARLQLGRSDEILSAYGLRAADLAPLDGAGAADWLLEQIKAGAWMIEVQGQMIGTVRLHSHMAWDRRAQLAIGLLDPAKLGRGYGSDALRLVISHAFGEMGLQRLSLRVLADNVPALRCYKRLGFVEEGRERQSARCWDGWRDDILMGLLATECEVSK